MKILAIDSTAVVASAAICDIENGIINKYSLLSLKNGLTHSVNLLPLIDSAIKYYGTDISEIELISVTAGPGSFTGVRIGVATVKGLAFSDNIPVCGISTLDALAKNCENFSQIICPVMDARRKQFYNALFSDGKRICDDRCESFEVILSDLTKQGKEVLLCGDGAALFKSMCPELNTIKLAPAACVDQNALSVALCGYEIFKLGKSTTQNLLKPIYLRISQAERERNAL